MSNSSEEWQWLRDFCTEQKLPWIYSTRHGGEPWVTIEKICALTQQSKKPVAAKLKTATVLRNNFDERFFKASFLDMDNLTIVSRSKVRTTAT